MMVREIQGDAKLSANTYTFQEMQQKEGVYKAKTLESGNIYFITIQHHEYSITLYYEQGAAHLSPVSLTAWTSFEFFEIENAVVHFGITEN